MRKARKAKKIKVVRGKEAEREIEEVKRRFSERLRKLHESRRPKKGSRVIMIQ